MKKTIFIIALFLLFINIFGLFTSLRNSNIYGEKAANFYPNDITLTEEQAMQIINKRYANNKDMVYDITMAVNRGMAHYWQDDGIDKYHLRIPIYENYILYILSYAYPSIYKKYEFCKSWEKALERGVGLCSQQSLVLASILISKGVQSKIVYLTNHVVVTSLVDPINKYWWVLDPDYGVIIEKSISDIQNNPETIKPYYEQTIKDKTIVNDIFDIYNKKQAIAFENGVMGYPDCNWKKIIIKESAYVLKWLIPIFLSMPYLLSLIKKNEKI